MSRWFTSVKHLKALSHISHGDMSKRSLPIFESNLVRLRLLDVSDLPMTRRWRNQDSIRKWFLNTGIISEEQHLAWFARYHEQDDDFVFIIEKKENENRPVGQVSIYQIDWSNYRAEYGRIMIGEADARGKGLAKAATKLVLEVAFGALGLKVVALEVRSDNLPALAVYRDCGFEVTGQGDGLIYMSAVRPT
jgi:RimJ/RimL family protein N-acetyltransferase